MEQKQDEIGLRVYYFWHKIFCKIDDCGDHFEALCKVIKCAQTLVHSNADVERSLSINKRVVMK